MTAFAERYAAMTRGQARDTAQVLALGLALAAFVLKSPELALASAAVTLAALVWPPVFRPLAFVWFGLAEILGWVMTRVIFSTIFFLLVTPVGLCRRMCGLDPMERGRFKDGQESVFRVRDHQYAARDLERMF
jgi:fatty acid desaturase